MSAVRRAIALALVAGFLAIPIGSFVIDWRIAGGSWAIVGYSLFALGALISLQNFYWRIVRPWLHALRGRSPGDLRNISSAPLFGMLTVVGLVFAPASLGLSIACVALVLADTGNILWGIVNIWGDPTFWSYDATDDT